MLQDMASWSRDGIAGLQSVVLYSLPELDGAIDTVPLGGLVGDNIFLVSERVTRLSQRIKKWVHLRHSHTQVGMFCLWLPLWLAALPCPALPCPALLCPVCLLRCHALPFPSLPCPTLPCPASVFAALLCPALLCRARPCSALPCPAQPRPALPCPALPWQVPNASHRISAIIRSCCMPSHQGCSIRYEYHQKYGRRDVQSSAMYLHQSCYSQDPKIAMLLCGSFQCLHMSLSSNIMVMTNKSWTFCIHQKTITHRIARLPYCCVTAFSVCT